MTRRISVFGVTGGPLAKAVDPQRFQLEIGTDPRLDRQVIVGATDMPIGPERGVELAEFVRRGGGLVLLGGTLAAWSQVEAVRQVAGWMPSGPTPLTELIIRPSSGHPVTQDLDPEWRVRDRIHLSEGPPAGAEALLRTSWRFTDQVVAYVRDHGEGRVVYLGLGHEPATYEDPQFRILLGRLLMYASGHRPAEPVGVGLLGYGAIARDHAAAISAVGGLRLAAVCDLSRDRRELAAREWQVRTHERQQDLLDDPGVGLVVVGTPPSAHAEPVLAALAAGKHVVCEKPFAIHVEDADRMIDAAQSRALTLTVYQSRRWDPDFIAMRQAVRSGRIGVPFYMEAFIGGFEHPCDYWHSHEPISGGTIYDWGSHYFDWILQLFEDRVVTVAAQAHKLVWHDVTNADQVRVDLTFAGGAQATFLQSDIAAARKPKWYLLGTAGAVVGDWVDAPVPADLPARVRVLAPSGEEVLRLAARDENGFYRGLASHLAWAEPLAVSAEEARRNVAVMEAATQSIGRGGELLQVSI